MLLFCPSCSNMLIISQIPSSHTAPEDNMHIGKNRFECRTCPYQMVLDRRYYERKNMKLKDVGDILGGAESWANVDQTEGMSFQIFATHSQLSSSVRSNSKGIFDADSTKQNALKKAARAETHISDKFKFEVQTSP